MPLDTGLAEWMWVGGYSSVFTVIVILVIAICCSIAKNRFLLSSTHYTIIALGLRNVLFVIICFCIFFLTKLQDDPQLSQQIISKEGETVFCEVVSTLDTFCSALLMFYLLGLAIHMMCRNPNPVYQNQTNKSDLRVYDIDMIKEVPVPESPWLSPMLLLLPLLIAILVSLPTILLHLPHTVAVMPAKPVCVSAVNINHDSIIAMISTVLPVCTVILLFFGMFVRRCVSCNGGECISSICKEEMLLVCLMLPYSLVYFWKMMPVMDKNLVRLGLDPVFADLVADDSVTRGVEALLGLLLPFLTYLLLPAYRMFSSYPDSSDLYQSKPDFFSTPSVGRGGVYSERRQSDHYSQEVHL